MCLGAISNRCHQGDSKNYRQNDVPPREWQGPVPFVLSLCKQELKGIYQTNRSERLTQNAEKLARFARLDPKILRPIAHRTVAQQEALTLIRARNLRLRTAAVNAVRGLAKPASINSLV